MAKKDKQPTIWNWKFIFGIAGLVISVGCAAIGMININNILMLLGVFIGAGSGWLAYIGYKSKDEYYVHEKTKGAGKTTGPPPNCIIICPDSVDAVYMENAPGMLRKCFNNGKRYHLLLQENKSDKDKLKDITLPDDDKSKIYYSPKEFANATAMPSNKKYFEWSATMFQKIAVGVMAIIIVAEIIGMVVLGG